MLVERNAIASEEKTSGKYHKVQLRTLCVCLWMLWQELGVAKKKLAGFTAAARLDTERQVALSGFRYKTALDGCLRHRLPAR